MNQQLLKLIAFPIMLFAFLSIETQAQVRVPSADCSSWQQGSSGSRFSQTLQAVFIPRSAKYSSSANLHDIRKTNMMSTAAYALAAVSVYSYFQSKRHYDAYSGMEVNSLQRENAYTKANNYNKIHLATGVGAGVLFTSNIIFTYLKKGNGRRYVQIEKKWTSPSNNEYKIALQPEATTQHFGINLALNF